MFRRKYSPDLDAARRSPSRGRARRGGEVGDDRHRPVDAVGRHAARGGSSSRSGSRRTDRPTATNWTMNGSPATRKSARRWNALERIRRSSWLRRPDLGRRPTPRPAGGVRGGGRAVPYPPSLRCPSSASSGCTSRTAWPVLKGSTSWCPTADRDHRRTGRQIASSSGTEDVNEGEVVRRGVTASYLEQNPEGDRGAWVLAGRPDVAALDDSPSKSSRGPPSRPTSRRWIASPEAADPRAQSLGRGGGPGSPGRRGAHQVRLSFDDHDLHAPDHGALP